MPYPCFPKMGWTIQLINLNHLAITWVLWNRQGLQWSTQSITIHSFTYTYKDTCPFTCRHLTQLLSEWGSSDYGSFLESLGLLIEGPLYVNTLKTKFVKQNKSEWSKTTLNVCFSSKIMSGFCMMRVNPWWSGVLCNALHGITWHYICVHLLAKLREKHHRNFCWFGLQQTEKLYQNLVCLIF